MLAKLEGDVAESWTVSPDQLTFTFKIRKGIKFHDGTPLTAKDVASSYERMRSMTYIAQQMSCETGGDSLKAAASRRGAKAGSRSQLPRLTRSLSPEAPRKTIEKARHS